MYGDTFADPVCVNVGGQGLTNDGGLLRVCEKMGLTGVHYLKSASTDLVFCV